MQRFLPHWDVWQSMFRLHFSFWVWSIALGILVLLSIAMVLIGAVAYFAGHSKPIHAYRFLLPYGLFFLCMLASYLYIIHSWKRQQCLFFCATTFVLTYDIFNYEESQIIYLRAKALVIFLPSFFTSFVILWLNLRKGDEPAMDKHLFTFQDLMAFGMFMIALLTFIFSFIR